MSILSLLSQSDNSNNSNNDNNHNEQYAITIALIKILFQSIRPIYKPASAIDREISGIRINRESACRWNKISSISFAYQHVGYIRFIFLPDLCVMTLKGFDRLNCRRLRLTTSWAARNAARSIASCVQSRINRLESIIILINSHYIH